MRKTFDAELLELNEEMTAMAASAQEAIDVVTESLTTGDEPTAQRAVQIGSTLDQMERDIENRCLRLLLRQQPVARDLRTISTAMKMVTDLQRIGDQAANIAEISILLSRGERIRVPEDITLMSRRAGVMVKQAIAAYTGRDTETAAAVINLDDEVDDLFAKVKTELIERITSNREDADDAIDLIIIAKYLERVADHAVNIAQWAIFCVTGQLVNP
ncbi:MAG: phosphate signaling complex protein PhoU [Oscillospiraceae bacterium]